MDDLIILTDSRPTRADAVRNRDLILRAARDLIDSQSAEHVTMSAIAHEAGVGKGTLYRNFPDKVAVCQALLDRDQRDLQDRTLARLREGGPPLDDLLWFIGEVIGFVWRNLDLLGGEAGEVPLGHPAHFWWRQTMRGLAHQIVPTLDADHAADVLFILTDPRAIAYQRQRSGAGQKAITVALQMTARRVLTP